MIVKDLDNIDIVFHIGDISYANGYISQWDQFTAQVEPITSRVPYMLARSSNALNVFTIISPVMNIKQLKILVLNMGRLLFTFSGNHERDWPNTGSFYGTMDSGGECGVLAETMFYIPAENSAKYW